MIVISRSGLTRVGGSVSLAMSLEKSGSISSLGGFTRLSRPEPSLRRILRVSGRNWYHKCFHRSQTFVKPTKNSNSCQKR